MMAVKSWTRSSCIVPDGNQLIVKGSRDHVTKDYPCFFPDVNTRANFLPGNFHRHFIKGGVKVRKLTSVMINKVFFSFALDYSAHYNVLNMKNILQTTLADGSKLLLVCDPKRDL